MGEAGGSAQREYDRRLERDRARRRAATPRALVVIPVVGLIVYLGITQAVAPMANEWLGTAANHKKGQHQRQPEPVFPDETVQLVAIAMALAAMGSLATAAWGRRGTTESWRKGAEGERATAQALEPLLDGGWVLLNDLRIPGSRANIDHVLIGPPGVFVIETKNYSGTLKVGRGGVSLNGRPRDRDLDEAIREANVVDAILGPETAVDAGTRPLLWVHGATVETSPLGEPVLAGVRIGSSRKLLAWLKKQPVRLTSEDIDRIAERLTEGLPADR